MSDSEKHHASGAAPSGEDLIRTNEELRQRVAELEALFELAPVGLAIARDAECRRIDPNPAMRRLLRLGLEANASRTAPPGELPPFRVMCDGVDVPPEDLPMQVAARTGQPVNGSHCHVVFPNGDFVHLLGSSTPLFDEDHKPRGCIGAFLEITDHVALERELRQARRVAEDATRAKDLFLATLSHELRSPLSAISLVLHFWEQAAAGRSDDFREDLQVVRRNTDLLTRLVDDLLDLQRIAHGKASVARRPLDLHTVLTNAIASYRPAAVAKKITLDFKPAATSSLIYGDATRLQQVVGNVLNNAVKFTDAGGIDVATTNVDTNCNGEPGRFIRVLITDTGTGFSVPGEMLFRRFEQGGHDTTRKFGGLGLGLAICKGFVEAHEGRMAAHSDGPGRGTVITLDLPLT